MLARSERGSSENSSQRRGHRHANTPGEATVTKTLAKRISVSFASYGLFSLPMSASVVPFVESAAVCEQPSSSP